MSHIRRVVRPDGVRVLAIREGWSEEAEAEIGKGDFDCLSISSGQWGGFEFLSKYVDVVRCLSVSSPVDTYRGIEKLTKLIEIDLEDAPSPPLNLLVFSNLQRCSLRWHKRYPKDFFSLPMLTDVTLSHYPEKDCVDIAQAGGLARLDLRQSGLETLDGLQRLKGLRHLSLSYMRSLQDVSAAGQLRQLQTFHLEKCPKVTDVEFIKHLSGLEKLFIDCGGRGFDDIAWMANLEELVDVLIAVPVNVLDWDVVFSLPRLRQVVINSHAGYELSDEELHARARANGRELLNYMRAGTRKHPAFKFWMKPKA